MNSISFGDGEVSMRTGIRRFSQIFFIAVFNYTYIKKEVNLRDVTGRTFII